MNQLEELLRSTLHDPARELTPAPGSIDAAVNGLTSLRRRRLAILAALAATAVLGASGIFVTSLVDHNRAAPAPVVARPSATAAGVPDADVVRQVPLPGNGVMDLVMDSEAVYVLNGSTGPAGPLVVRVARSIDRVTKSLTLATEPAALALAPQNGLWVATRTDQPEPGEALLLLDRRTLALRRTVPLPDRPEAMAVAGSTLWVGAGTTLYRLDANDGSIVRRMHLDRPVFDLTVDPTNRLLWATVADEVRTGLIALDARTGNELARRGLGGSNSIAAGGGSLWVAGWTDPATKQVRRLDPRTLVDQKPGELSKPHEGGLVVWPGGRVLWVGDPHRAELSCFDPVAGRVLGTRRLEVGGALVADDAAVYSSTSSALVHLSPQSVCGG